MPLNNKLITSVTVTLLFLLLALGSAHAQTSSIEGQVTNTDQKPTPDINVALQGTQFGDVSNTEGNYIIRNIPPGNYILVVSSVRYADQQKSIAVEKGKQLSVDITLSTSNEELQEIVVQGKKINKFATSISKYVSKIPVKKLANPQVYNTVNAALIKEQVITSFDDILKNAPGITKLWESTGRGGDGIGYYSLRGFPTQPTMVNGLPSLASGSPDLANIARVEVVKGPSGTLYGSSLISYGGLVNVITKKPYEDFGGEVSYKTGSFGLNRIAADVNTPVSDELFLRINTAYETANSFLNSGFAKSFFIAPSLRYEASEKLSFSVNTEFYRPEGTNPLMLFLNRSAPLEAHNPKELAYNSNLSYTSNDITIRNPTFSLQTRMNYQISDSWRSETSISRSSAKSDGYYSYLSTIGLPENQYGRYVSDQNVSNLGTNIQQNFNGDFNFAGMNHKALIGFNFLQQKLIDNSSGSVTYDVINLQNDNPPTISEAALDTMLASAPVNSVETRQRTYSAYVLDIIEIIPRLSVMASLRIDHFANDGNVQTSDDDYQQTALSPKFGLVFQPVLDKVSVFANYMNGFTNEEPRTQGDGSVKTFEPEHANQWEVGVKTDLYDGRVTATLSYYDINVSNIVRPDPNRANFFVQNGEKYSRGIEVSLTASPVAGLNINAGYSYNESELTSTSSGYFASQGRRPEGAGPKHLANAWISYQFTGDPLQGLGIGLGGNYASENKVINRPSTGVFSLPSYTVFNASVFYNTNNYRLDLKVNNFTDEQYYSGWSTLNPEEPRAITAGFTYKF